MIYANFDYFIDSKTAIIRKHLTKTDDLERMIMTFMNTPSFHNAHSYFVNDMRTPLVFCQIEREHRSYFKAIEQFSGRSN